MNVVRHPRRQRHLVVDRQVSPQPRPIPLVPLRASFSCLPSSDQHQLKHPCSLPPSAPASRPPVTPSPLSSFSALRVELPTSLARVSPTRTRRLPLVVPSLLLTSSGSSLRLADVHRLRPSPHLTSRSLPPLLPSLAALFKSPSTSATQPSLSIRYSLQSRRSPLRCPRRPSHRPLRPQAPPLDGRYARRRRGLLQGARCPPLLFAHARPFRGAQGGEHRYLRQVLHPNGQDEPFVPSFHRLLPLLTLLQYKTAEFPFAMSLT
jgi:hypothetical protein